MVLRDKERRRAGFDLICPLSRPHPAPDAAEAPASSPVAVKCSAETDSPLEGAGFEPLVPASEKALFFEG
jgi:hypothetical protein